MKLHLDDGRCQGHGRCYDLAPELFDADEEGYGRMRGGGLVPTGEEHAAQLAAANCPERAIDVLARA